MIWKNCIKVLVFRIVLQFWVFLLMLKILKLWDSMKQIIRVVVDRIKKRSNLHLLSASPSAPSIFYWRSSYYFYSICYQFFRNVRTDPRLCLYSAVKLYNRSKWIYLLLFIILVIILCFYLFTDKDGIAPEDTRLVWQNTHLHDEWKFE